MSLSRADDDLIYKVGWKCGILVLTLCSGWVNVSCSVHPGEIFNWCVVSQRRSYCRESIPDELPLRKAGLSLIIKAHSLRWVSDQFSKFQTSSGDSMKPLLSDNQSLPGRARTSFCHWLRLITLKTKQSIQNITSSSESPPCALSYFLSSFERDLYSDF